MVVIQEHKTFCEL